MFCHRGRSLLWVALRTRPWGLCCAVKGRSRQALWCASGDFKVQRYSFFQYHSTNNSQKISKFRNAPRSPRRRMGKTPPRQPCERRARAGCTGKQGGRLRRWPRGDGNPQCLALSGNGTGGYSEARPSGEITQSSQFKTLRPVGDLAQEGEAFFWILWIF